MKSAPETQHKDRAWEIISKIASEKEEGDSDSEEEPEEAPRSVIPGPSHPSQADQAERPKDRVVVKG